MKNHVWFHFVFGMIIASTLVAMIVACGSLHIQEVDWKSMPRDIEVQESVFTGALAAGITAAVSCRKFLVGKRKWLK